MTPTIERVAPGLVRLDGVPWRRERARKATRCALTGKTITQGALVYAPPCNGWGKTLRILASAIDAPRGERG